MIKQKVFYLLQIAFGYVNILVGLASKKVISRLVVIIVVFVVVFVVVVVVVSGTKIENLQIKF